MSQPRKKPPTRHADLQINDIRDLPRLTDDTLLRLRALLEVEMRRRGLAFSVGDIGERLVLEHFNKTSGLPVLLLAPRGTKNVDALSRNGERYSIKTIWKAKKTGTVYPDSKDANKQLFEFLLVCRLSDDFSLRSIHQFTWDEFLKLRSWDRRMSAWYVACSERNLRREHAIYSRE